MILLEATVQKRNLLGACVFIVLAAAAIIIRDPSFSTNEPFLLIGAALGYLGFAIVDYRNVMHQVIRPGEGSQDETLMMLGPVAAVWFTAIGPLAIGFVIGVLLGILIRMAINYFSLLRLVGVRSPIAIMEVGGNDQVKAQLFFKPRFTTAMPAPVNGTITFYKDPAAGLIYNLSNGAASDTIAANTIATETLTGTSLGTEVLSVMGSDTAGNVFVPRGIDVHVVQNQTGSLTFYRLAVRLALKWWLTGLLGNLRININSNPPAGLCDQWMDWAAEWLISIGKGDICKIEKCLSASGGHNYLRITMCDGTVYYLDPWRRPDDPIFGKSEYEDKYGKPSDAYDFWVKPPARGPQDCQKPHVFIRTYDVLTAGYRQGTPKPSFDRDSAVDSAMGRLLQDAKEWCGTAKCKEEGKTCLPHFESVKVEVIKRYEIVGTTGFVRCYAKIGVEGTVKCRCGTVLDVEFPHPDS